MIFTKMRRSRPLTRQELLDELDRDLDTPSDIDESDGGWESSSYGEEINPDSLVSDLESVDADIGGDLGEIEVAQTPQQNNNRRENVRACDLFPGFVYISLSCAIAYASQILA